MGNIFRYSSEKCRQILLFFAPRNYNQERRNDEDQKSVYSTDQETQNDSDRESLKCTDQEIQNGNDQEIQHGNVPESQTGNVPETLNVNDQESQFGYVLESQFGYVPESLNVNDQESQNGNVSESQNGTVPESQNGNNGEGENDNEQTIPATIPLLELSRGRIIIPNNKDIVEVLSSHARSINQIIYIESGKGFFSNSLLSPLVEKFNCQILEPLEIIQIGGAFHPSGDKLGENYVVDSETGWSTFPNVSMVIVLLMGLPGYFVGHRLITHGDVELEAIFYSEVGLFFMN